MTRLNFQASSLPVKFFSVGRMYQPGKTVQNESKELFTILSIFFIVGYEYSYIKSGR